MRNILATVVEIAGFVAVVAGVALVSDAAALIVGGLIAVAYAYRLEVRR